MSDFLTDTPSPLPVECPACKPDLDPRGYMVGRCTAHEQGPPTGLDDARVTSEGYLGGGAEAGGDDNRRWCELLNRPKEVTR